MSTAACKDQGLTYKQTHRAELISMEMQVFKYKNYM